ncbi:MAG: hypothetical protein ACREET_15165 [Stellaceae bacterium]
MSPVSHAFLLIGGVMAMGHNVAASGTRMPWKIGEATAKRLAAEAVYGADKYLDAYDFDANDGSFVIFNTSSKPPAEGGFGFFAVNLWTGDVWALWGCHRLSTPALRKSQAAIRRRFTRAELKQYASLRRLKPLCIVED